MMAGLGSSIVYCHFWIMIFWFLVAFSQDDMLPIYSKIFHVVFGLKSGDSWLKYLQTLTHAYIYLPYRSQKNRQCVHMLKV